MPNSYAPVDVHEFKLTIPMPCPTGKPLRVSMGSADRPWCPALHVSALPENNGPLKVTGKLGGRVGANYVRDLGFDAARTELWAAFGTTAPLPRLQTWTDALELKQRASQRITALILGRQLDSYQLASANGATYAGSVMALSVGLGKTLIALCAAIDLGYEAEHRWARQLHTAPHIMVVCPLNAMSVWKDPAIYKLFSGRGWTYSVVSADSLHKIQAIQNNGPAVLIVDEAHYFGNWSAQRTKLIHKIRWQFDACLPLTGSMLHAGPEKVLSLLDLACPGAALYGNIYEFGEAFECMYSKDIGGGVLKKAVGRPPARLQDAWQKYLDRFVVAKTKRSPDVMVSCYIPEQQIHDVDLFDPNGPSMLDEAAETAKEIFDTEKRIPSMIEVVHKLARQGLDDKLDWLADQLQGFGEQAVLFGTYHETLDGVEEWIKDMGCFTYCRIDGAVTGEVRTKLIDEFRAGKYQIMLAQTDAASVSMNLQTARISVMLDTTQKAANFEQALGRTCRRGSTDLCHHFNLGGNRFQKFIFNRLKNAMDFNAAVAEWQDAKRLIEQSLSAQGQSP